MMNRWTTIKTEEFSRSRKTADEGIKIEISLSPYDVPEAVKGSYCSEHRKFIISFKYLTKESTKSRRIGDYILVKEGVGSNRLIEMEIDVTALNVEEIKLEVAPILKDFYESLPRPSYSDPLNHPISRERVTGEIIEKYRNEIFA